MSLSSLQLDAFVAVSKNQSFSAAAKELHITQSALSQRILNLEAELGSTLFIRESSGIRLTELGQKLLRYCLVKNSLETDFLEDFGHQQGKALGGIIKIGGFSSVVRSVLIPSLSSLLVENGDIQVEFFTKEVSELPNLLESGKADFILLNHPYEKQGVENIELGYEESVLVEARNGSFRKDVFLDHDSSDSTTSNFFKVQSKSIPRWKRSYFDEIYTIIDGVLLGAGRAVIPLHLIKEIKKLHVVKEYKSMKTPVYLCYYKQAYYTSLQNKVIERIKSTAPKILRLN